MSILPSGVLNDIDDTICQFYTPKKHPGTERCMIRAKILKCIWEGSYGGKTIARAGQYANKEKEIGSRDNIQQAETGKRGHQSIL